MMGLVSEKEGKNKGNKRGLNMEVLNIIKKKRMKHLLLVCLFAFAALALTDEEWTHVNIMNLQA